MAVMIQISQKDFDELFEITLLKMKDAINDARTRPFLNDEHKRFQYYLIDLKNQIEKKQ
jgi:hypothetical protein